MSSVDELREKFVGNSDAAREAFEELAARLEALEMMRLDQEDQVRTKMQTMKEANMHQREKLHRLREKYQTLLELYNDLAEERKDGSDSSSSDEDEDDGKCSLM
eukprot:GFUD01030168.1.p2 GENE.GFUD01030168.1~~GFUD01030168.1.p2  ORF type:complete len:104 (-),score=54.63 GFUD01030168.1:97-408(-)